MSMSRPQPGDLVPKTSKNDVAEEGLGLYRLKPVAQPDDPSWDISPNHGEVVVRARSAADARLVAAEAELDAPDLNEKPSHGTSTDFASSFRNERLYTVVEEPDDAGAAEPAPRGVVTTA